MMTITTQTMRTTRRWVGTAAMTMAARSIAGGQLLWLMNVCCPPPLLLLLPVLLFL